MRRIVELDALRGIAAIGIVAFHYSYPSAIYDRALYVGSVSLEMFFVLSGFLISSIILSHAGQPGFLRNFYLRRGLRIWPIYYLAVLAYGTLVALRPNFGQIRALPYYLTFTQNVQLYWFGRPPELTYALGPTWSLAIEEQFYILWPFIIILLGRRHMAAFALASIALAIGARWAGYDPRILIARCDGFALGGLLAVALSEPSRRSGKALPAAFWLVGAACFLYLAFGLPRVGTMPFEMRDTAGAAADRTVVGALFACIIGLVVCHEGSRFLAPLRARWLCYLGTISYGIYLYHLTALTLGDVVLKRLHLPADYSRAALAPLICLAISAASWAWIEKPALRLKERFRYGKVEVPTPLEVPPAPAVSLTTPDTIG